MLNRKGRTKKEFITIDDELINPYIIKVDEDNYTICLAKKPEMGMHYCSSLASALKRIARLKNIKSKTETIQEYINGYNNMLNKFKETIAI